MLSLIDIIKLGMTCQLKQRDESLRETNRALEEIVSYDLISIVNQYVHGDSRYIQPEIANLFCDDTHSIPMQDHPSIRVEINIEPSPCCDCESEVTAYLRMYNHDKLHCKTSYPIARVWNWIVSGCDHDMFCDLLMDALCDVDGSDRCTHSSYECQLSVEKTFLQLRERIVGCGI